AVVVVVLAVDVGGDGSAAGVLARAVRHRYEPTQRHDRAHQVVEADAGVEGDDAGVEVQGADPCQLGHVEYEPASVLGGVAVAAPQAAGNGAPGWEPFEQVVDVLGALRVGHVGPGWRGAPPSRE